ncbi:hypothetical protein, variant, partial [Sphaeroforma arctica JP610]
MPNECYILLLIYLDRISQNYPSFCINSFNAHRMILTGLVLAAKFSQDRYFTNTHYARVGGLPGRELKALELEFLARITYALWADSHLLEAYWQQLLQYAQRNTHQRRHQPLAGAIQNPPGQVQARHNGLPMPPAQAGAFSIDNTRVAGQGGAPGTGTHPANVPYHEGFDPRLGVQAAQRNVEPQHSPAPTQPQDMYSQNSTVQASGRQAHMDTHPQPHSPYRGVSLERTQEYHENKPAQYWPQTRTEGEDAVKLHQNTALAAEHSTATGHVVERRTERIRKKSRQSIGDTCSSPTQYVGESETEFIPPHNKVEVQQGTQASGHRKMFLQSPKRMGMVVEPGLPQPYTGMGSGTEGRALTQAQETAELQARAHIDAHTDAQAQANAQLHAHTHPQHRQQSPLEPPLGRYTSSSAMAVPGASVDISPRAPLAQAYSSSYGSDLSRISGNSNKSAPQDVDRALSSNSHSSPTGLVVGSATSELSSPPLNEENFRYKLLHRQRQRLKSV